MFESKLRKNPIRIEDELSEIVIPFREFITRRESEDIYNGEENIPFFDREVEFRNILISEFLT
jgi:hypothetical protein